MNIQHEQCKRCGRDLKTEKSRRDGFGPVCKKKWLAEHEQGEQMTAEGELETENDN